VELGYVKSARRYSVKRYYDPLIFNHTLDSVDHRKYLIATYYVEDSVPGIDFIDHFDLLKSIIIEGSVGSWMEVKEEIGEVRERYSGKLLGYYEVPSERSDTKKAVVQFGFSIDSWEHCIPMMILSIAGNCFAYSPKLRLLDISLPEDLVKEFQGPKFGISGIRKQLGVKERPLILHIIKPKMGMRPEQIANQVYQTALGGIDMCKDDEMTSDTPYCKFEDRLNAVMKAIDKAENETGKRIIYFINVTDEVNKINKKARKAVKEGGNGLLFCYSAGLSALRVLTEDPEVDVPVLLHPSYMLSMIQSISYPTLAKLCRLCGADLMLNPTYWSSIPLVSLEEGIRTSHVLTAPLSHIKRTWPMPAAGMYPGLLPTIVREFGTDIIIPAGGGVLGHPQGYTAGAKAWMQAVDAVMEDLPLEEAAKTRLELKAAIDHWGVLKRPYTPWLRAAPKYHPKRR
jgi:2,3-diketo-5-methylthiopentyl-1-phosphate enolase